MFLYSNTSRFQAGPRRKCMIFFVGDTDALINQLIGIIFPQNMKSMEKYYRWLSKFYVEKFHRIHKGLVDTIFRYNNRREKGRYLAKLAERNIAV